MEGLSSLHTYNSLIEDTYQRTEELSQAGRPFYQNAEGNIFISFDNSTIDNGEFPFWGISSEVDASLFYALGGASFTDYRYPEYVDVPWEIASGGQFEPSSLRVVCAETQKCYTGQLSLRVHMVEDGDTTLQQLSGLYFLRSEVISGRPVYKHESRERYLYYLVEEDDFFGGLLGTTERWVLGAMLGSDSMLYLTTDDSSQRPELITSLWDVEEEFFREVHVLMICTGIYKERMYRTRPRNRELY